MKNGIEQVSQEKELIDLTHSQLLFWTGQKIDQVSPLYNMALTFEFSTAIDVAKFKEAFQLLVQKSDTLRIVFEEKDGIPFQKMLPSVSVNLDLLDLSDQADNDQVYDNWLNKSVLKIFDTKVQLYEAVLIKFSEQRYVFYLNQHHLITDAWAVSVLYNNLIKIYQQLIKGETVDQLLYPSFKDYVFFEKQNRLELESSPIKQYWADQLKQLPLPPRLYGFDQQSTTTRAQRISLDIGLERSEKLREIAMEKGIRSWTMHLSLFNIFSSLLFTYLYRISGQESLSIGTPAHNRPTQIFKNTAGVFIEVYPLLAQVSPEDSFLSLIKKVQIATNGLLKNAQPGASQPALSRSFNVVLNYINASFSEFENLPVKSEWVHTGHVDPRHHLRLQVYDFDASGTIQLHFDLNEDIFEAQTRALVPQHFLNLLDAFIENRETQILAPKVITNQEYQKFNSDFNQNFDDSNSAENIVRLFTQQAANFPNIDACSMQDQTLTYADLDAKSNQLAHYLKTSGISSGDRVAVYLERSFDLVIAILGVLKAGAAFIPIAANYPKERINYMLQDSAAKHLLTNKELSNSLDKITIDTTLLDENWNEIEANNSDELNLDIQGNDLAYIMYTSGSTGKPKGVMISNAAINNYIQFAKKEYVKVDHPVFPLFTMIGFDLTITSILVPLVSSGTIRIYKDAPSSTDLSILDVIKENKVDVLKLTPSHLELIKNMDLSKSMVSTMIVGGEAFKPNLAKSIYKAFNKNLNIYNEYGPTEASVGCVVYQLEENDFDRKNIPIGKPIPNTQVYILDQHLNPVPQGVTGELYLAGRSLANGYFNQENLTAERFIDFFSDSDRKMYRTGDFVRINKSGELEYLGRKDNQVKIGGIRIELGEIEVALAKINTIDTCTIIHQKSKLVNDHEGLDYCTNCGLPSNYPDSTFDEVGACNLCNSFESYQKKASKYFKTREDLKLEFDAVENKEQRPYDCMMLLSGGKDSSYALGQLGDMGLKVLAFTLDNGYISEQAKDNITRVTTALGVDHIFGETAAMNEIFVDSLKKFSNVCNGCFKVLYTLSTKIALEKNIPYIVTGLSRGQFFETRLTEELFWKEDVDIERIDDIILNARKAYHRVDDAVSKFLDVSMFEDDQVFEKVQFLDFYRYSDVSMDEMMHYLDNKLPWIRPTDTGRSTNCLINQVGIYVHKKERGFSNYAFPYSWDVRLGHKQRDAALDEINEELDEKEIFKIMDEIGYDREGEVVSAQESLIAYYTGEKQSTTSLKNLLSDSLPAFMIPTQFKHLNKLPLTTNGKVDVQALLNKTDTYQIETDTPYVAPSNQIEEMLCEMWSEVLSIPKAGIHYMFLDLGGTSLSAIRLTARINDAFELDIPVKDIFDYPTIAKLGKHIESIILSLLEESH